MKQRRLAVAVVVWLAATVGGLCAVTAHSAERGQAAEAPSVLAAKLRAPSRPTLVVAAHPACPCTRATFHELERIVVDAHGAVDVVILFAGRGDDRVTKDLRASANALPGARVIDDPDRALAKELGAHTSGTVLFYDAEGRLRFSGGITPSRGHEGDSTGGDTVRALVRDAASKTPSTTPIYGCALETVTKS